MRRIWECCETERKAASCGSLRSQESQGVPVRHPGNEIMKQSSYSVSVSGDRYGCSNHPKELCILQTLHVTMFGTLFFWDGYFFRICPRVESVPIEYGELNNSRTLFTDFISSYPSIKMKVHKYIQILFCIIVLQGIKYQSGTEIQINRV